MKRFLQLAVLLFVVVFVGGALAASEVRAPRALSTPAPEVSGDEGEADASDDALSVVLDLVVSDAGGVTSSVVVRGVPPFAELARQATLSWRFEPAQRDGQAVSAKVRVQVELRRRPRSASEAIVSDAGAPANPDADGAARDASADGGWDAAVEVAEDVRVLGERPLAPHVHLLASEVREMPGAFGDAFRAMEAMPGVIPIVSGLPYFIIRGAPPGNTGFFIDGVRVPGLFHFGIGEAVVHPGLIQSVDLYSGAYPARFGRFAGGILSGDVVPPGDKMRGEVSVRILDSGALIEVPFADGRGDVTLSGRYGYPGLILSLVSPNVGLQYWDYQARSTYRFRDGSVAGVFAFGSFDSASSRNNSSQPLAQVLGISFERVTAFYSHPTAYAGEFRIEATAGLDRVEVTSDSPIVLNSQTYSLEGRWTLHPSVDTSLRVGADIGFQPYRFNLQSSDNNGSNGFSAILPSAQNDLNAGLYGELTTKLSSRISAEFGARGDLYTSTYPGQSPSDPATQARQVPTFDPRITLRYSIASNLSFVSAIGTAHQASNIPLPIPALSFSQLGRGLQTAYQASEGVEAKLPWDFSMNLGVFGNDFVGLAQLTNDCPDNAPNSCATQTVHGRAYGVEFLLRRPLTEKLSGWISYTLSRSERDYFDGTTGIWTHALSEFDRTHVGNVIVAYDLGANWRVGGRVVAYSGWPYSTTSLFGVPNARMPAFVRFDLRIEKRWNAKWGHVSFIAEGLNVLGQKEAIAENCTTPIAGKPVCTPDMIGPITIPSIGTEVAF